MTKSDSPDSAVEPGHESASRRENRLALSEEAVFADFSRRVNLTGSVVAEVGGTFPTELLCRHGVERWYSIEPNPGSHSESSGVRRVLPVGAEETPLPDESVDAVFSSNAFQFVDVAATLAQMRRILKPGGLLYAHFGPIWSAVDGHQLEYVSYEGRPLTFWDDTLLPAWAHLLYGREELRALLRSRLPDALADLLVWHVHDSDTINRMFFEDYVEAALASGLGWVELSASDHLDYEICPPPYDPALVKPFDPAELQRDVSARRRAATTLGVRDVLMVLRKPVTAGRPCPP